MIGLCFRLCHYEGSGKIGWLKMKWYTSASGIYADDANILSGNIHTIKENREALVVDSRENGLQLNADRTKYMVMSRDQNVG